MNESQRDHGEAVVVILVRNYEGPNQDSDSGKKEMGISWRIFRTLWLINWTWEDKEKERSRMTRRFSSKSNCVDGDGIHKFKGYGIRNRFIGEIRCISTFSSLIRLCYECEPSFPQEY